MGRKREERGDGIDGGGGKEPKSLLYSLCSTLAAAI